MKPRALIVVVVLGLVGCAGISGEDPQRLLAHDVAIPKEFRAGMANPHFPSPAQRYLDAYDGAWWACIGDFAREIDHVVTIGDKAGNGWPAAVTGYWDGYSAAEARVKKIKARFGDTKAQALFRKALEYPE
jgi:hypothetical protein